MTSNFEDYTKEKQIKICLKRKIKKKEEKEKETPKMCQCVICPFLHPYVMALPRNQSDCANI